MYDAPPAQFFKPAGDGLLVVWEETLHQPAVEPIIRTILAMFRAFELPLTLVPKRIPANMGIGVTRSSATCVTWKGDGGIALRDYFGFGINLAAKLQNFAKPSGIVIEREQFEEFLGPEVRKDFANDSRYVAGAERQLLVHPPQIADTAAPVLLAAESGDTLRPPDVVDLFPHSHGYVCVVQEAVLRQTGVSSNNDGLIADKENVRRLLTAVADPTNQLLLPRDRIEDNPAYRQIIPCAILRCGKSVFTYLRSSEGTERRLGEQRSLFVGGHLTAVPNEIPYQEHFESFPTGKWHSVFQKIAIRSGAYTWSRLGVLWGDKTPINRVHLGIVYLYEVNKQSDVEIIDNRELPDSVWRDPSTLQPEGFDSWSGICLGSGAI